MGKGSGHLWDGEDGVPGEGSGGLGRPLQARLRHRALIPRAEGSCYLVGCGNLSDIVEVGVL